jgi:hypothetical protein
MMYRKCVGVGVLIVGGLVYTGTNIPFKKKKNA